MPISRRYMFHGHAAPLGGRIVRMGEGKDAKAIKDAGLPPVLADRLYTGE